MRLISNMRFLASCAYYCSTKYLFQRALWLHMIPLTPYTRSRGMLPPDKVMDLLRQCNPPVGWGKLCPHALACKVGLSICIDLCTFETISLVLIHNFIAPVVCLVYQSTCGREIHLCSSWWSTSYLPSSDWISLLHNKHFWKKVPNFLKPCGFPFRLSHLYL